MECNDKNYLAIRVQNTPVTKGFRLEVSPVLCIQYMRTKTALNTIEEVNYFKKKSNNAVFADCQGYCGLQQFYGSPYTVS